MHIDKFKLIQCPHVLKHIERAIDESTGEYIKFGNQNIDTTKTYLNYRLDSNNKSAYKRLKEILSRDDVKLQKRDDVKVVCSVVLTCPKDVKPFDEERFFEYAHEFLLNRYAPYNNEVCCYIHKDENRGHCHYCFCPLTPDMKYKERTGKERLKVSAKIVVNREDLQTVHKELDAYMTEKLGYQVEILNGNTTVNCNMKVYKNTMSKVDELKTKINVMNNEITRLGNTQGWSVANALKQKSYWERRCLKYENMYGQLKSVMNKWAIEQNKDKQVQTMFDILENDGRSRDISR